ncbi:MAG: HAMP domain-containing sensor histidine kinase, partial [Pseudomonadota bacterium]
MTETDAPATPPGPTPRWRPPLALLVAGAVGAVLTLPTLGMAAVVALSRSPDALIASLIANWPRILLAETIIVACAGLVAYVLWRTLARPIEALAARAEAVAAGGGAFDPSGPHGTREIARVAASFSLTVEELQRRTRYLETFTAHLAHELKSPLTAIQGAAELLADPDMPPERRARFAGNIGADAHRLTLLVNRLRDLARADMEPLGPSRTGQGAALSEVLAQVAGGLIIDLDTDQALPLNAENAGVIFGHIADNARRHGASRLIFTKVGATVLRIANDGAPIPPEEAHEVLTPFFTTTRAEGGTGLGLAIAAAMLRTVRARITLAGTDPVAFD